MTNEQVEFITYAVWLTTTKHQNPSIDFLLQANQAGITNENWQTMNTLLRRLENE